MVGSSPVALTLNLYSPGLTLLPTDIVKVPEKVGSPVLGLKIIDIPVTDGETSMLVPHVLPLLKINWNFSFVF